MNFSQMFQRFDNVTQLLNILAQSNRFRRVIEIQNDIIQTIREKEELESQGTNSGLYYCALNEKIVTLRQEKYRANRFDDLISNDSDQTMNNANKLN